jgi:hypothetical protein
MVYRINWMVSSIASYGWPMFKNRLFVSSSTIAKWQSFGIFATRDQREKKDSRCNKPEEPSMENGAGTVGKSASEGATDFF